MEISGGTMKNDDISAIAFHRFISQPASGHSSALPLLAAFLVLSIIWGKLHLHSLFFRPRWYSTSCKTAQVLFCFDYRCLTSKSLRLMCQALLTISNPMSENQSTQLSTSVVYLLTFPLLYADKQAYSFSSSIYIHLAGTVQKNVHH